jgi:hypothetical protein
MRVRRASWYAQVEAAGRERPVVWRTDIRRVGKSVLRQSLPDAEYHDCEPRVDACPSRDALELFRLRGSDG